MGPMRGDCWHYPAMTTPNKISIFRILLVPFFIVQVLYYIGGAGEWHRLAAVIAFGVAAISDGLDGYIARRYNQRSELGTLLDPLADKLLLLSGVVLLSLHGEPYLPHLPMWLTATVISRDTLLVLGALLMRYVGVKLVVKPHLAGKVATVLQMTCVLWALLKLDAEWLGHWSLAAAVTTGLSGAIYIVEGVRQLSSSPAAHPVAAGKRDVGGE